MESTKLTLEFRGVESNLLREMVESGLFNTKSEAIRAAVVRYGTEIGLINKNKLWEEINKTRRREGGQKSLGL